MKKMQLLMVCVIVALVAGAGQAAYVLSDNVTSWGDVLAVDTPKIATGATYEWLNVNSGAIRGATDSQIIAGDVTKEVGGQGYFGDMMDGYSELAGGAYAIYGTWSGSGTNQVATAQFDLKDNYLISSCELSLKWSSSQKISDFEIWVSDTPDFSSFTLWAAWDQIAPADSRDARLVVSAETVEARYVQFYTKRAAYQQVLGEMVIYGDAVPEPATIGFLMLGAVGMIKKYR